MVCFAKRGFHQASMHDISAEAGISVGLIYRYFENKEAVISAMARRHKKEIQAVLERARQAPTLLESLEILFTAHCCENSPKVQSAFVVDLYAESSAISKSADWCATFLQTVMACCDRFDRALAGCSKTQQNDLKPHEFPINFCRRPRNADAGRLATARDDRSGKARAATGSSAKTLAPVVQNGNRISLCMTVAKPESKVKRKSKRKGIFLAIGGVAGVFVVLILIKVLQSALPLIRRRNEMPATTVTSAPVKEEDWPPILSAVGSISPVQARWFQANLVIVSEVMFQNGGEARKGDVLVKLEASSEVAQLKTAEGIGIS